MTLHFKEKKHLSAKGLLSNIHREFQKIPKNSRDNRGKKSGISNTDCLLSGLALFGLKFPSLLQFEHEEKSVIHNLKKLYYIDNIPCDTYMRERLDEIDSKYLRSAFTQVFSALQRGKALESYKFLKDYFLVACDGTGIFSSKTVHCENCCQKNHRDGSTTYYHQLLAGVLVHPDHSEVFPFCPEPISKIDGSKKNDCERNSMRRFLKHFRQEHPHLKVIFTYDALFANGPCIQQIKESKSHFIIGVKPKGNKSLFEWLKGIKLEEHEIKTPKETLQFKFLNKVPLNDTHKELEVNFFECRIKNKKGEIKHFTWITDIPINRENIHQLSKGGRARWQIENETFNTLKNQGYHFEHNFGHGYKHLSNVFGNLMFLAFLIDQVQQSCCALYQAALKRAKSRIRFFKKIRSLFTEFYIDSWEETFAWISSGKRAKLVFDSS